MNDKTTNIPKAKCHKVKNPCKICFQRVGHRNGLRCEGACKRWVHYKCLQYTPGRIADIKAGVLKVMCPCPDCVPSEAKEFLTNPPFTCSDTECPANQFPKCTSAECPKNMEGEDANPYPESKPPETIPPVSKAPGRTKKSKDHSGPSKPLPEPLNSLPPCVAREPRPNKLCQSTKNVSSQSVGNTRRKSPDKSRDKSPDKSRAKSPDKSRDKSPDKSRDKSPDKSSDRSCKAKMIALKDKLSAFASGKLCPSKQSPPSSNTPSRSGTPDSSPVPSKYYIPLTCTPKTCKTSAQGVPKSNVKQIGSNQSMAKVQFKKADNMDAPKKSKSFAGLFGTKPAKTKNTIDKKDCPASTSDSVIEVSKGQDSLLTALDDMCNTVGRLTAQIKNIMCKLDAVK